MQVLALSNTTVVAAARPTDDFERLSILQHDFDSRLMIVEMELLDPSTVEESKDSVAERSLTHQKLPQYIHILAACRLQPSWFRMPIHRALTISSTMLAFSASTQT